MSIRTVCLYSTFTAFTNKSLITKQPDIMSIIFHFLKYSGIIEGGASFKKSRN